MRRFFGVKGHYDVCKNSAVEIGAGSTASCVKIKLKNSTLKIGTDCDLDRIKIKATNTSIVIGNNSVFIGRSDVTATQNQSVIIGNNCLIANGCWITTSDLHQIYDADSGNLLNPEKSIEIKESVWLAREVVVLKGVTIGMGAAIGIRSVVTKPIPPRCLAAGIPAKVVRTGISWKR